MSSQVIEQQLQEFHTEGEHQHAMKLSDLEMKIQGSHNQVIVLLFGLSGAGKSSTVDYLFGTNVGQIRKFEAVNHSTIEYKVEFKSTEFIIPDFQVSIVDTPSFCDVDDMAQNAKNIMTIKYFLKSCISNRYPNLVMIVHNIMENSFAGQNSGFVMMLNGISIVNAINGSNPNVVVVLTHAMGISRDPQVWKETVKSKRSQIQTLVQFYLGIKPEIVVIENEPEVNNLKRDGDWYLLPNGDKQPQILYEACEKILIEAKDEVGQEAVTLCVRSDIVKTVMTGQIISSSTVKMEDTQALHTHLMMSNEWMSLPSSEQHLQKLYLEGKRHPAMLMADLAMKMNRSPTQVSILLFGLSGAGKKSTVDHLFGTNVGETRKSLSVERSTIEYTVKLKSNEGKIPDLQLSIIDTPSFCDVDGQEQDAKNVMSTKYFLESSPYIINRYPNLVMIILNIMDHRIAGHNSDFAKMLKGINKVNAVDLNNHNVVVVLTHAMGIAINPKVWRDKVEMKKAQVQVIVQEYWGFNPEIVVIENEPEDNDLEHDGNWHLLPNGDKQPKILYEACERILIEAKDEIGHAAVKACFQPITDQRVRTGKIISSSAVKIEDTHSMRLILLNLEETVLTSEVGSMLENYKRLETEKEILNDIFMLQVRLSDLGISKICDLQRMSMNTLVAKMNPTRISKYMHIVLKEMFGLSIEERVDLNNPIEMDNTPNQYDLSDTARSPDSLFDDNSYQLLHRKTSPIDNVSCFPEDSLVMLHNQKQRRMKDISVGDRILIAKSDDGTLTQDEVITWIHQVRNGQFTFLQIVHNQGKITLTPEHIIFVGKNRQPKHASSLIPGDQLYFITHDNNRQTLTMSIVLSILKVKRRGIYAPLTYSGRLLVENVDVSCYCTLNPLKAVGKEIISSHTLAHAGFLPLRIAFKLGLNISNNQTNDETGIHGYARWLMKCILR